MISPWFAEALDAFVRKVYTRTAHPGVLRLEVDADFGASVVGIAPGESAEIATSCGTVTVSSRPIAFRVVKQDPPGVVYGGDPGDEA